MYSLGLNSNIIILFRSKSNFNQVVSGRRPRSWLGEGYNHSKFFRDSKKKIKIKGERKTKSTKYKIKSEGVVWVDRRDRGS